MRPVTDELLFSISGVTATVIGLFLVGVFLFVEAGLRRTEGSGHAILRPYMRAGTRIVMVLFAMPLLLPLALAALDLAWARALFVVLCVVLVAANVETVVRVGTVRLTGTRTMLFNEIVGTVGVVVIVVLPWVLGGLRPSREDLTLSALVALATAFVSVCAIALTAFDIGNLDQVPTASTVDTETVAPEPASDVEAPAPASDVEAPASDEARTDRHDGTLDEQR